MMIIIKLRMIVMILMMIKQLNCKTVPEPRSCARAHMGPPRAAVVFIYIYIYIYIYIHMYVVLYSILYYQIMMYYSIRVYCY